MDTLKVLSSNFILSLVFGTFFFQFLVNPTLTGKGFIRLILGILIGGLILICALNISQFGLYSSSAIITLITLVLSLIMYAIHPDKRDFKSWFLYGLISVLLSMLFFLHLNWKEGAYIFLGALLLGLTNFTMVLGHYYLVVPKLTVKPLINGHYFFWPILFLKICLSLFFIFTHLNYFEEGSLIGEGSMFNTLLVAMRVLWGYVALGILSIFSYKLCRMRSTQSATGVLYIMVFFVLVGELISFYQFFKLGWFI